MTPPCKKCDVHVSTNADGLCGKCAPAKPLTTLDRVRAKYADDDRVTFAECGRSFELEHVEVGGRRIACLNETSADDATTYATHSHSRWTTWSGCVACPRDWSRRWT